MPKGGDVDEVVSDHMAKNSHVDEAINDDTADGRDIGGFGQAPKHHRSLSSASKWRGRFFLVPEDWP